uniref:BRCA1-associated RING domain protein 1 (BARD-1) n=1 Tax=Apis cerana TaxID=7461 RepID=V9IB37_APICE
MIALVRGIWLLNSEWIQLNMDISDILKGDLELFEVSGAPIKGIPKKARESAQNWVKLIYIIQLFVM